jgi:hypothetical protein
MTTQIPEHDWERLGPEAQSLLCLIAGLREGRFLIEAAEHWGRVSNAVVDHLAENEKGDATGPKGTLTLTLEIAPNKDDVSGNTVAVTDKLVSKRPEDRRHVVYVGRRGTLHTRQDTEAALFAVLPTAEGGHEIAYPPDRAAGPDG